MNKSRRRFLQTSLLSAPALSSQLQLLAKQNGFGATRLNGLHHEAKAKRFIFIFLTGGFSHLETFDPKPALRRDHGKMIEAPNLRGVTTEPIAGSPFEFKRYGKSGIEVSEIFPKIGSVIDDLCVIRSMKTDIVEHFQASLALHTGSATVPMPSIGSWLSHGLGSENPNLPSFVALCENLPYGGAQLWDSNFLPPIHQGSRFTPGATPVPNLSPAVEDRTQRDLEFSLMSELNRLHQEGHGKDIALQSRQASFETARGMMDVAPQILDSTKDSADTLDLYGIEEGDQTSFGWQCLTARKLAENGVRTVEVIESGASDNWDSHGNLDTTHQEKAARVDQAIAALITDLKQRGMLEDTLVAIGTEFGRTPFQVGPGRNHWAEAFTCLLAGGGVKGGTVYGETDEHGMYIAKDKCHVHDYHATILHLMGIDHTRLTYRYAGRDFRLTDVFGKVLHPIIV